MSKKFLVPVGKRVLGKDLGFTPTPNMINEAELRKDFDESCRKKSLS